MGTRLQRGGEGSNGGLGFSIYETFRTYNSKLALMPEHQARFERSLKVINWQGEIPSLADLASKELLKLKPEFDLKIKVLFSPNGEVECESWGVPVYKGSFIWHEKWRVKKVQGQRSHPEVKNNLTEFVSKERAKALAENYDEILLISADGNVKEGGWTNVFFEKNGILISPAEGMLPGIARDLILLGAKRLEIPLELREVHESELEEMDNMFLTSSVRGIVSTGKITANMQRLAGFCSSLISRRSEPSKDTLFMGVINMTPDSFSDGGRFVENGGSESVLDTVQKMIADGAKIIDIGGESSGPGSKDVSVEGELKRTVPIVKAVREKFPNIEISIDTCKAEVAEACVQAGATMINDVSAGRFDPRIAKVASKAQIPLILMYSKDPSPRTSKDFVEYEDVILQIKNFLQERIEWARAQGVEKIIIDPGMGAFVSANPKYSFEIMERLEEFKDLNCPILLGVSRKSCLGEDRLGGTLATTLWLNGRADILRVHDVLENVTVSF